MSLSSRERLEFLGRVPQTGAYGACDLRHGPSHRGDAGRTPTPTTKPTLSPRHRDATEQYNEASAFVVLLWLRSARHETLSTDLFPRWAQRLPERGLGAMPGRIARLGVVWSQAATCVAA